MLYLNALIAQCLVPVAPTWTRIARRASPATTITNMDQNCTKGITRHHHHQHGPELYGWHHLPPHHQHGPELYEWHHPPLPAATWTKIVRRISSATAITNMDQNCTERITRQYQQQHGPELHEGSWLGLAPRDRGPDDRLQPLFYLYNLNVLYLNALITQCLVATTITNMDQNCTKNHLPPPAETWTKIARMGIANHYQQQHGPELYGGHHPPLPTATWTRIVRRVLARAGAQVPRAG